MRFYHSEYPQIDDIVFIKFNRKTDHHSVIVNLIEYDNIEGMILNSEIHKKRVNPEKIFGNKIIPCLVLNVDEEKKHIDLSYKRVTEEDRKKYQLMYPSLEKIINLGTDILELYSIYAKEKQNDNITPELIYDQTIWKLFEKYPPNKNNLNELYENILANSIILFENAEYVPIDFINRCTNLYKNRIKITEMVVTYDFKLQILSKNGIEKLKDLLLSIIPENLTNKIKIECVSSPIYRITITSFDQNEVDLYLNMINETIQNKLDKINGIYNMEKNMSVLKKKNYSLLPLRSVINSF